MKKLSLLLIAMMVLCAFAGCGVSEEIPETTSPAVFVTVPPLEDEPVQVDPITMTHYDLECGLSFSGPGSLKEKKIDNMAAYMDSGFFLVMVIEEPKTDTILADMTPEEYAEMLTERNKLDPCVVDRYGNLATCYVADSYTDDGKFFYYVTVKETADSFWLVQFVCPAETAEKHVDSMAQWSSTFTETPTQE